MKLYCLGHRILLLMVILGSGCGCNSSPGTIPTDTLKATVINKSSVNNTPASSINRGEVNLSHLNFLVEDIDIAGQPMAITHIYSESPSYEWVDASGEGIACVDDSARAALIYLEDFERTHDPASINKAQRLLNFVLYMQAEDGQFYNFILDRSGTINKTGNTSFESSGWWAARAARAIGAGYRVMRSIDPTYASRLELAFLRIRDVWANDVAGSYGKYNQVHAVSVPAWLIADGSDVTSIAVLALLEYDRGVDGQDELTRDLLIKLCEAMSAYQAGDDRNYPFGLHPDSATAPFAWHAWGSTQVFALARAGQQLVRPEWIASAQREADTFYARLLAGSMVGEWGVMPFAFPQIAYGLDSLTQGLLALHQATGDDIYGKMAGLAAGWFYGNNAAGFPMYDPTNGRGYDGLLGPSSFRVNMNSGAESTIEALMAIQAVSMDEVAVRYLRYLPDSFNTWQVLEAEDARQTRGNAVQSYRRAVSTGEARWSNDHYILLSAADSFVHEFTLPESGSYYLYVAYLRQGLPQEGNTVEAIKRSSPLVIDGDLGEWSKAQQLSVTTTMNIVRGAAGWGGSNKDAFIGYMMWDEQNLYVAARVLSPTHKQTEIGPSVWKGDALWVYLSPHPNSSTVEVKLTLAQTPQGPQIWNWKTSSYLAEATMAWKQGDGFYNYEAALPWKSLHVNQVQAGDEMRLELGRGCCGSGFQDLLGTDPDVAANLAKMILVEQLSPVANNPVSHPAGADAVALKWNLDGVGVRKQLQAGSPDRDYLWLERLTTQPVELTAGQHKLLLDYGGVDLQRAAAIDGFLLMPAMLTKSYTGSSGNLIITYDIALGRISMEEH